MVGANVVVGDTNAVPGANGVASIGGTAVVLGRIRKPSDGEFAPHFAGSNGGAGRRNRSPKVAMRGS